MTDRSPTIKLSDGSQWTKLAFPPGFWSMTREGSAAPPMFCHEPFVVMVGGFSAADHRKIADVLDPPTPPSHVPTEITDAMALRAMREFSAQHGESHDAMWSQMDEAIRRELLDEWKAILAEGLAASEGASVPR